MRGGWLVSLRSVALVALAGCAALLVDFTHVLPTYSGIGSGCFRLSRSVYGFPLGRSVPLPLLGLLGFAAFLGTSLLADSRRRRRLLQGGASAAGLAGLGLATVQGFVLHAFGGLCLLVELCGVALAALAWVGSRAAGVGAERQDPLRPWAWAGLAALAIAAPLVWPGLRPPDPLPPGLAQLEVPGQLTVVEFTDFECPACRALHPVLASVLKEQGDAARLVRIHFPIPAHRFARGAARAVLCAEQQGRGEALADVLFQASDLSAVACRSAALDLGVDRVRFDECVAGDAVEATLKAHAELLRATGVPVLPTTYVGRERLIGRVGAERLRTAFERAKGGGYQISGRSFAGATALCACVLLLLGRRRPPVPRANQHAT